MNIEKENQILRDLAKKVSYWRMNKASKVERLSDHITSILIKLSGEIIPAKISEATGLSHSTISKYQQLKKDEDSRKTNQLLEVSFSDITTKVPEVEIILQSGGKQGIIKGSISNNTLIECLNWLG
jgi:hypothetical protein